MIDVSQRICERKARPSLSNAATTDARARRRSRETASNDLALISAYLASYDPKKQGTTPSLVDSRVTSTALET